MTEMNNLKKTFSNSTHESDISNDSIFTDESDEDIKQFKIECKQEDKTKNLLNSIKANLPEELQRHILKVKHTKCKICDEFKLSNKYYFDCCNNIECLIEYGEDNGIIDETNEDLYNLDEIITKNVSLDSGMNRSVRLEYRFHYNRHGGSEYNFCEYYLHTSYPYQSGKNNEKEELQEEDFKLYKDDNNKFIFIKDITKDKLMKKKMVMLKILEDSDECIEIDTDSIWENLNIRYSD